MAYVLSLNLHRRHLTTGQRAMVGARAREIYDREAAERKRAAGERGKEGGRGHKKNHTATSPEGLSRGEARELVGAKVGVGGKTIDAAALVKSKNGDRRQMSEAEKRAVRAADVREKRAAGMSNRAIAEVLGVDEWTVRNDLKREVRGAPAPEPTTQGGDDEGGDDARTRREVPADVTFAPLA